MSNPSILVLLGTNRTGCKSERVAKFLLDQLAKKSLQTTFISAKEFTFPAEGYGPQLTEKFPAYKTAVEQASAILIVAPEYNHGYPGVLKNILDLLFDEYSGKTAALAVVSAGPFGGTRLAESLLPVLRAFNLQPLQKDFNVSDVGNSFGENGEVVDENYLHRAENFLQLLINRIQN